MDRDRVTGAISAVLGACVAVGTWMLPKSSMRGDVGPKVFPAICAALFLICGIGLLIKGSAGKEGKKISGETLKRLGVIAAVVIVYVIALDIVGFMVPTFIVLFVMCTMFSENMNIPLWRKILYAVVITLVIYFAFEKVMILRLPRGRLF